MNAKNNRTSGILRSTMAPALVGGVLVLASTASAQQVFQIQSQVAPTAPTAPRAPKALRTLTQGDFHGTYSVVNGKDEVKVESNGTTAEVRLNGALITTLNLDEDWTRYEVQNADGKVVATLLRANGQSRVLTILGGKVAGDVRVIESGPFAGTSTWTFDEGDLDELREFEHNVTFGVAPRADQPKVMIGVYLGDMDEDAAAEGGLDPEGVTEISGVVEGGPAASAGLQAGDVITGVNGQATGDLATIRDALAGKNPGDTLTLTVLRDGQSKQYTLALKAYDAEFFNPMPGRLRPPMTPDQIAAVRTRLSGSSAQLAELSAQLAQATGGQADEIREKIRAMSAEIAALSGQLAKSSLLRFGDPGGVYFQRGGAEGKQIVVLNPNGQGQGEPFQVQLGDLERRVDEKLAEFDTRMDEMERRIDRKLDELVDELVRRMKGEVQPPR